MVPNQSLFMDPLDTLLMKVTIQRLLEKKHILSYPFLNSCFWPWIFLDLSAQHRPFGLGVGFVGEFVSSETKVETTYGRCRYVIHASKFKSQQANRTSNMVGCPYSCNAIVTTRMSQLIFSFATIYWERWPNPNIASLSKQLKLPYHHLPPQNFKPIKVSGIGSCIGLRWANLGPKTKIAASLIPKTPV